MEDTYQKYRFSAISIKKEVAVRFRAFSRLVSDSHTHTLEAMMNFFEWNGLLPTDDLGVKNDNTGKRINALIAIVRNIEKQQTLPTKAMLDTLFQEMSKVEVDDVDENFDFGTPEPFSLDTELDGYQNRYEQSQERLYKIKRLVTTLVERITYVKGTFGNGHLRVAMDREEFEKLKKELDHVHHHHSTES